MKHSLVIFRKKDMHEGGIGTCMVNFEFHRRLRKMRNVSAKVHMCDLCKRFRSKAHMYSSL